MNAKLFCFTAITCATAGPLALFAAGPTATVSVHNPLGESRSAETVVVPWQSLHAKLGQAKPDGVVVKDAAGKTLVCQPIFLHGKKAEVDQLVFQADFKANETATFTIEPGTPAAYGPRVYGRWIPERYDDFAWENDKVAFRAYGPELEKVEPAGPGIDTWQKSTPQLVINTWYQMAQSVNDNYYHIDHGQGMDGYHVGQGQGCGGTALWLNGKRFTTGKSGWKTQKVLANGPIRLVFELTYDPIVVDGVAFKETKRVTLDAGQFFNHFESTYSADKPDAPLHVMAGIYEHPDRSFETQLHADAGWMSYWSATDERGRTPSKAATYGHTGCAAVMPKATVEAAGEVEKHLELRTASTAGKTVSFWAGSCWDKGGDFADYAAWNAYVAGFAARVNAPLEVTVGE